MGRLGVGGGGEAVEQCLERAWEGATKPTTYVQPRRGDGTAVQRRCSMQQQSTGADNRWGAGTMRSGLCIYCGVMVVVVVVVVVVVEECEY